MREIPAPRGGYSSLSATCRQKLRRYRPPEMSANAKAAYSTTVPTRWRFHAAGTIPSSRMRRTIATTCATILYLPIVSADRTMPCEAETIGKYKMVAQVVAIVLLILEDGI